MTAASSRAPVRALRRLALLLLLLVLVLGWPSSGAAQWIDQGPVFTLIEENDLVVNTDRHYTQGLKLSYLQADGNVPGWARRLAETIPRLGFDVDTNRFGYVLGQSIFTPADLSAVQLLTKDRPYAGWLYTGVILQRRGTWAGQWPVLESFQVDLGIIGHHSLADEAQTVVHEFRGFDPPRGWGHQLHDEPGLALKYQRSWLFSPAPQGPRYLDLIAQAGLSVGNVETSLRAGGILRVGLQLPDDFGVSTISSLTTTDGGWSPSRVGGRWGAYVFAGVEGWAVLYTAFLDGNLFRHGPHVDKEPFVAEWKGGGVLALDRLDVALTYVHRSREFMSQQKDHGYGSLAVKLKF